MTDKLTPVRCGCGGEAKVDWTVINGAYMAGVVCQKCGIKTAPVWSRDDLDGAKAEAITVWNRAMGSTEKSSTVERTAKAIEHDASVTDTDGYKYHRSEYLCGECKKKILSGDDYCSHCGAKLDWSE